MNLTPDKRTGMRHTLVKWLSFVPAILVMILIFRFSSDNATQSTALSTEVTADLIRSFNEQFHLGWTAAQQAIYVARGDFVVRKLAHFSEYCLLALTLIPPLALRGLRGRRLFLTSVIWCCLYACTDELHQFFVAGCSPQVGDVCIDTAGGVLGTLLWLPVLRHHFRRKAGK